MTVTAPPTGRELEQPTFLGGVSLLLHIFRCIFVCVLMYWLLSCKKKMLIRQTYLKKPPACFCFEVATGKLRLRGLEVVFNPAF